MHGLYKEYDKEGKLVVADVYQNGELIKNSDAVTFVDVKKEYYPDGKVKTEGTYDYKGRPHGSIVHYDKKGNPQEKEIYQHGILIAKGKIDEKDQKQGYWEYYYPNGQIKAKGEYIDNKKAGEWVYYYPDGKIEQKGK